MVSENLFTDIQWHLANQPDAILDWWAWLDLQAPCSADWQTLEVAPPPMLLRDVFEARISNRRALLSREEPVLGTEEITLIWELRECLAFLDTGSYPAAAWWAVLGLDPYFDREDSRYPLIVAASDYMSGRISLNQLGQQIVQFASAIPAERIMHEYKHIWLRQVQAYAEQPGKEADALRVALHLIMRDNLSPDHWVTLWLKLIFEVEEWIPAWGSTGPLRTLEKTIIALVKNVWPVISETIPRTYVDVNNPLVPRFFEWWWRHTLCAAGYVQEKWGPVRLVAEGQKLIQRGEDLLEAIGPGVVIRDAQDFFGEDEAEEGEEVDVVQFTLDEFAVGRDTRYQVTPHYPWESVARAIASEMKGWHTGWIYPVAYGLKDLPQGLEWKEAAIQLSKDVQHWYDQAKMHPEIREVLNLMFPLERTFDRQIAALERI